MQIPRAIPEGGMVTGKLNHALYSLAVAYQDQAAFVLQDRVAHNPEYFASHYVCILPPFPVTYIHKKFFACQVSLRILRNIQ